MKSRIPSIKFESFSQKKSKQNKKKIKNTLEGIILKRNFKETDSEKKYAQGISGIYPYLRGPYSSMYTTKKWTIRQYAGFSTAEKSNKFYLKNLAAGQKGLSVAFDLPTHRGYDSDNPLVEGDVGKTGVAIDTVEDMKILFKNVPLDKTSVSMTMNGAVIPIMAFYIVAAQESGADINKLSGTIQNDILKEFLVRNTYIYPPKPSMRIISDIFKFTSKKMKKFNSISISGYHMQEAGASNEIELAYTLANGLTYIKCGIEAGLSIDDFAPRLSFFWGISMNHFMEIAKMRAARVLWARIVKQFNPKNSKSLMLRTHCQTSGWSLTAQLPFNNISRTKLEALSAVLGGTQSLHTNALDEAIALPSEFSARIARNTQIHIQEETDICRTIDPYAGSNYVEYLTENLIKKSWNIIQEIEKSGGMIESIENGFAKSIIEKIATKQQAKIDSLEKIIIGINKFSSTQEEMSTLEVDNQMVRDKQIKNLNNIKNKRDNNAVIKSLNALESAAKDEKINLLEKAIEAAKQRATLGEISDSLEKVYKRFSSSNHSISGIYIKEMKNDKIFNHAKALCEEFSKIEGRQPRIIVAKIGQDGHDRGAKIISTSFADIGFDVDISPLFSTPEDVARHAIENDVHIIGISSLAAGHKTLVPKVIEQLNSYNRNDIMVIIGGVIPKKDYNFLYDSGVKKIFGPGSNISKSAIEILLELIQVYK